MDPVRHLIGAAVGWGGNPEQDAFYVNLSPATNDGRIVHLLHIPADVPVDGFWSVSVYNAHGYFEPNPSNAYSVNNISAVRNADGSVEIQFGGCDGSVRELPAGDTRAGRPPCAFIVRARKSWTDAGNFRTCTRSTSG